MYAVFSNVLETDLCVLFVPLRYSDYLDFCGLFSLFIRCLCFAFLVSWVNWVVLPCLFFFFFFW